MSCRHTYVLSWVTDVHDLSRGWARSLLGVSCWALSMGRGHRLLWSLKDSHDISLVGGSSGHSSGVSGVCA